MFNMKYLIQILWYKLCIVRYIFENEDCYNKKECDWHNKGIINKKEKDLCGRSCKSWDIDCDLSGKKFANKEEKDLYERNCKSWDIDCDLFRKRIADKREENLYTTDCKRQNKDLHGRNIENFEVWDKSGISYCKNNSTLLIYQF